MACRSRQHGAATARTLVAPPSGSAQCGFHCGMLAECLRRALEGPRCWDDVHGRLLLIYSIITHQHSASLSHFGRRDRVAGARLSASHGSWRMAAPFRDSTMKTSVFLLLLVAIACRLAQGDPNPVEELQVETLVSKASGGPSRLAAGNTIALDASGDPQLF